MECNQDVISVTSIFSSLKKCFTEKHKVKCCCWGWFSRLGWNNRHGPDFACFFRLLTLHMKTIHLPGMGLGKSIFVICGFVFWCKVRVLNFSVFRQRILLFWYVLYEYISIKPKLIVIKIFHPLLLMHFLY